MLLGAKTSAYRDEWETTKAMLLAITGQDELPQSNPLLERSIRNRFPYLDPLNLQMVEILKRYRTQRSSEKLLTGIQLTINGISAGLRNSGRAGSNAGHVPRRRCYPRSSPFASNSLR